MRLKDIPWFNRPGAKLKKDGASSLDDAELLSIIFGKGNKEENAIELSNKLLSQYNIAKLENASFSELKEILKDDVKVFQIMAFCELNKRFSKLKKNGFALRITCARDVFNIFVDDLQNKKKEYLCVLLLDTKNKIIDKKIISIGTLSASLIHPREVFNLAIKESANSIIVVHNHPSGDTEPSDADLSICERLIECGNLLGIKMLDFIVIGDGYWSHVESR
ncbi:MAG: DNA repair protein RadC [Candidatus Woesearchaeota archaeon]|jgi:DNA repair protein RadC